MTDFILGIVTMGYLVAGMFFAKFWSKTRDPLFASFAIAFWLLAASQALVVLIAVPREEQSWLYLLRLGAFSLIAAAIVWKNVPRRN